MEATSQYLNLRRRELSELDEGGKVSSVQDECDWLEFLADKVEQLRQLFVNSRYSNDAVTFGIDVLHDVKQDLHGTATRLMEEERNNR